MPRQFIKNGFALNNEEEPLLKDGEMHYTPAEQDTVLLPVRREQEGYRAHTKQGAKQDTRPLITASEPPTDIPQQVADKWPLPLRRIVVAIRARIQDPDPEKLSLTLREKVASSQMNALGWLPILTLLSALGLCVAAYGCVLSGQTSIDQENYFWLGLLLIFVPSLLRMISPLPSKLERLGILCCVVLSLYVAKVILNPLHLIFADEYLHLDTINNIIKTGHLFGENSLLPISPLYPGLEIVTDALSSLSGLNAVDAGLIVIGVARIVMVFSLFMLYEQIAKSPRIAGIAAMIYMCNSEFFFFNALYVYESLALSIGVFILFALARMEKTSSGDRGLLFTAWLAVAALVTTHHVTDIFFIGLLLLWTMLYMFRKQPILKQHVTTISLFGTLLSIAWIIFIARPVIEYLTGPISAAVVELDGVLTHSGGSRHLFVDASGLVTPLWQQLLMMAAVALIVLSMPFGCLLLWHRYRHKTLALVLGFVALLYPVTQAFRFANDRAGIADRSAPFVFIGVSFVVAIFVVQTWPTQSLKWQQALLLTAMISSIFLGGIFLGIGPSSRIMPGSFVVDGEPRSITPEGIRAATWTLSHLGPNNHISTDRDNRLLMATYGNQRIVTAAYDGVYIAPVFYSTQFSPLDASILQSSQIRYLEVDLRLSNAIPDAGYYFDQAEPEAENLTQPISRQALAKFDNVARINRIFDSGNIVIYDVGGFLNAPKKP